VLDDPSHSETVNWARRKKRIEWCDMPHRWHLILLHQTHEHPSMKSLSVAQAYSRSKRPAVGPRLRPLELKLDSAGSSRSNKGVPSLGNLREQGIHKRRVKLKLLQLKKLTPACTAFLHVAPRIHRREYYETSKAKPRHTTPLSSCCALMLGAGR